VTETVVIGAGPAGLTAAYELRKRGAKSTVLEADTQVGGISRTVNYRGYRFDIGGHRFFSKIPLINDLWRELLGEEFLTRPRLSRIHYGGHFYDYPLRPANAIAGLGILETALIGLSYAKSKIAPSTPETSFEHWVSNRFGRRLYEIFFKTYTEKVWGIPCTEISAEWAAQRIKNLSLTEAFRNALLSKGGCSRDGEVIPTLIEEFSYPRHGPGMMWERCRDLLQDRGSRVLLNTRAHKVRHKDGRVESVLARNGEGTVEFKADNVVSSMPLSQLVLALDPPAPPEVIGAAKALKYRDYLTVVLIVDRAHVFDDNWVYIHTPEVQMGRIQNYKNWSPDMVPDLNKTSLGLEYFLSESDEMWSWPDEKVIEFGVEECVRLGFIERSEVRDGTVVRMPKAYPVYDHEYVDNVRVIRNHLDSIEGLQAVGRNGQHRYNNQDHSMLTGVYAARNIEGAEYDVWAVNENTEYHEDGEVGLGEAEVAELNAAREARFREILGRVFAQLDPVALGAAVGTVCGVGLFAASAILLLRAGPDTGITLSLLGHFLVGYRVSWTGAVIGLLEAGGLGFLLGYILAYVRNALIRAYVYGILQAADAKRNRDVLDGI